MCKQLDFDFSARVENNQESNANLHKQAARFSRQCEKLYELLKAGVRMTCADALVKHGIGHLPRRVKDLRDAGINVLDEWIEKSGSRFKEYYL